MYFRLVMPSVDRLMRGGVVRKWHRQEGEHVDYGDDLVDVEIQLTMSVGDRGSMEQRIRLLKDGKPLREEDLADVTQEKALFLVTRIVASDAGVLRKIEARQGSHAEVGTLLAIFSSDHAGSADLSREDLTGASEFRVVANLIE